MNTRQVPFHLFLFIGLTVTNPTKNILPDRRYCGYQHTDDYPRPNSNISIDEFPWMVQLLYDENSTVLCSGSLISSRYVLTAAHCVRSKYNTLTMVRLGDYNVKTENDCVHHREDDTECSDPVQQFHIEEIIQHPSFNRRSAANDIALLRLSEFVVFSEFIRPICLPKKNAPDLKPGDQLSVSGWGLLSYHGPQTDLKKRVTVTLVSNQECAEAYKSQTNITNDHLCATESDSFTCMGDSGAPLMYSVKNQWEQVGVVSFANGCGPIYPTGYAKVSSYLDWIEETVRA